MLGRYGQHESDAPCKLGSRAEVVTLREGLLRNLRVDWEECLGTHKNRLELKREELFEGIRSRAKDWLAAAERKAEALQLSSLALELEEYLERMAEPKGEDVVAPAARRESERRPGSVTRERSRQAEGSAGERRSARPRGGIQISWDAALRRLGELRVAEDGVITVGLNPVDPRIRNLRERAATWRSMRRSPRRMRARCCARGSCGRPTPACAHEEER